MTKDLILPCEQHDWHCLARVRYFKELPGRFEDDPPRHQFTGIKSYWRCFRCGEQLIHKLPLSVLYPEFMGVVGGEVDE